MQRLVWIVVLIAGLASSASRDDSELVDLFVRDFQEYHATGVQSPELTQILEEYALPEEKMHTKWHLRKRPDEPRIVLCALCRLATGTILDAHDSGATTEEIGTLLVDLCDSLNLTTYRVCAGTVEANIPVLDFILNNTTNLTSDRMCGIALHWDGCGNRDPSVEWSLDIPPPAKSVQKQAVERETKANPFTVVQLTDIHYDPYYLVGGNAYCGEPMCCRADQGEPEFENATAGQWGHYHLCDIPWEVVTDGLTHIANTHQVDYVYMTGDLVDHGVWDTSYTRNNETIVRTMMEIKNTFGDVPVFPCIGNHEAQPLNVFAPVANPIPEISTAWLYESLADLWGMWLPADTRETILAGGYYTALVRPGFRVVALNNQQCYIFNWFLINDAKDPDGQLQWLVGVLLAAEAAGEKVHILYHIPVGDGDCYYIWSREFNRIINRFENTVTGQFTGHTHWDHYTVFYDQDEPTRPINVAYTAGSLTSYSGKNGNYRVYTVDGDDFTIDDHETWIYNMTEANASPSDTLNWFKMYSFKDAYNVSSLSPVEMDRLAHEMAADEALLYQYFEYYYLKGDPKMEAGCDADCLDSLLCGIVTSDSGNSTQCDAILGGILKKRKEKMELFALE